MSDWKEVRLGEVCDISSSKRIFAKEYVDYGVPFYRSKEVIEKYKGNKVSTELFISQSRYNEIKKNSGVPSKGDILLTSVGTLGVPWIVNDETFYFKDGNLTWLRNFNAADSRFLFYWIISPDGVNQIYSKAIGSTQKALTIDCLKKFEIKLPPLDEQRRIAGILGALDDKIELNNRINANLEAQAAAIFRSWFVDFEPFASGEFIDSSLGKIPKGWKVGKIQDIARVIYGAPYKSKLFNNEGNGLPLIRIRDLKTNSPQFYTPEILPNTEFIAAGDILVGMDAEFRPYIWFGYKGVLNQRVCKFVPNKVEISNYFVYSIIKPHLEFIEFHKVGTTVSHIGKSDIDKIEIIIPQSEVLINFTGLINPIYNQLITNKKKNQTLSTLRDTLLPKLMKNEI